MPKLGTELIVITWDLRILMRQLHTSIMLINLCNAPDFRGSVLSCGAASQGKVVLKVLDNTRIPKAIRFSLLHD